MSELEALLLGIVQGLTEFLPISSSGHLIFVPWLQDYRFLLDNPDFNRTFDVALHAGTLVAAVAYFRREIRTLTAGFLNTIPKRAIETADERLAWAIAVGTVPAVIVGAFGEGVIEDHLAEPWLASIMLIVFGLVLLNADGRPEERGVESTRLRDGLWIGLAQVVSLIPGTSRSGITITAGRYLGLDRDAAARVSFLLLVPVAFGAAVFSGAEAAIEGLPEGVAGPIAVGTIAAAVSGYAAIAWLLRLVRTRSYAPFVAYRVLAGGFFLLLIATGARSATFG